MRDFFLIFLTTFFIPSFIYITKYFIAKLRKFKVMEYLDSVWIEDNKYKIDYLLKQFNEKTIKIKDKYNLIIELKYLLFQYPSVLEYFFICSKCYKKFSLSSLINFIEINKYTKLTFKIKDFNWFLYFDNKDIVKKFHNFLIAENEWNFYKDNYNKIKYSHDIFESIYNYNMNKLFIYILYQLFIFDVFSLSIFTYFLLNLYIFEFQWNLKTIGYVIPTLYVLSICILSIYMYINKKSGINKYFWEKDYYSNDGWWEFFLFPTILLYRVVRLFFLIFLLFFLSEHNVIKNKLNRINNKIISINSKIKYYQQFDKKNKYEKEKKLILNKKMFLNKKLKIMNKIYLKYYIAIKR